MSSRPYDRVLEVVGSQKALVELSGVRQSTVSGWQESGIIPLRHIPRILAAASDRGISLSEKDFLPSVETA
jgi:DNA-binding transcriptional regulator YdaS (Cro superfamily)